MTTPSLDVSPDADSLAFRLADWLVERIAATTGKFALNLSGGSTPKRFYSLLASEIYRRKIDWERVHIFYGDERFVPYDHPDSNYKMTRDALLSKVPIPEENVCAMRTDLPTPAETAAAYEKTLKNYYGKDTLDIQRPLFSVTLLGLGEDGHTASLFPDSEALNERRLWVTAVVGSKPEPRITLTYPVLESSAATIFLVAGSGKRDVLTRLLAKDTSLPASTVDPQGGFVVFCDEAANGDI